MSAVYEKAVADRRAKLEWEERIRGWAAGGWAPVGEAPVGEAPVGEAPVGEAPVGERGGRSNQRDKRDGGVLSVWQRLIEFKVRNRFRICGVLHRMPRRNRIPPENHLACRCRMNSSAPPRSWRRRCDRNRRFSG